MYSKTITIQNKTGLHARPANLFVSAAKKFKSDISVEMNSKKANAKSIITILTLGAAKGSTVTISAEGTDEETAVDELVSLIESGFGE